MDKMAYLCDYFEVSSSSSEVLLSAVTYMWGVIFAQTQTPDLGVCHLRLVDVIVQRDVNKFNPFPLLNYFQLIITTTIPTFKHKKQLKTASKGLIKYSGLKYVTKSILQWYNSHTKVL